MEINFHREIEILKEKISSAKTIILASHMNPDGDNLGSKLAMYKLLLNLGKKVYVVENDEVPTAEEFLPNVDKLVDSEKLENSIADLFICLDCGDLERIGRAVKVFKNAAFTVNIDHHASNTNFADLNIVDDKAPAVCELLYILIKEMGFSIDRDIATCLYTGLSTDTGSFKYDSIRPLTFEVAKKLLEEGIDKNEIVVNLYQRRSREKTDLLLTALKSLKYFNGHKIAVVTINNDDTKKTKARKSDADGIVEFIRDIDGVELAIFIKEKEDSYRISTRSKSYLDVSKLVKTFGGGGHIRAAGATLYKDYYENIDLAIKAVVDVAIKEF